MIAGHTGRNVNVAGKTPGSELAVRVRPPAQRLALAVERAAVRDSDADRRDLPRLGDAHGCLMRHRRTIAELPAFVLAPTPRGSTARDGAGVRQTRRNRRKPNVASDG